MNKSRVLLVDDDAEATLSLSRMLRAAGFSGELQAAGSLQKALEVASQHDFHVAVVDLTLNPKEGAESGFRLIAELTSEYPCMRIIVLTGSASLSHGIRALHMGAAHFLEKPAEPAHLLALIQDAVRQSELKRAYQTQRKSEGQALDQLVVGNSAAATRIKEELRFAASNAQALLITGETGTGKGLCARAVHVSSARAHARFVRYQPNFSNADLVNSDLFGYEKSAFTGADSARKGLLEEAHTGTLFLDEIDELPLETQVTLLGVFQERKFRPLGSNQERDINVRLICASNRDLEQCLKDGKLRKDFYHRIAHARIHLPPLRERKDDIPLFVERILETLRAEEQISVFECSDAAFARFQSHDWPGNVRELEAVIEGAAYRAQFERRSVIFPEDVPLLAHAKGDASDRSFTEQVRAFKLSLIDAALKRHEGNQMKAAQDLKLDRSTLRRILEREGREKI